MPEKTFHESDNLFISNKRIISDGKTYPINSISSVRFEKSRNLGLYIFCFIIAVLGLYLAETISQWFNILAVIGIISFTYSLFRGKKNNTYSALITLPTGDQTIVSKEHEDLIGSEDYVHEIVSKISDAIAEK